jgi:hypothetical protein
VKIITASRVIAIAFLAGTSGSAAASDTNGSQSGKAAAHAALAEQADLPTTAPQLPLQASDQAREALANTAFGKKGQAAAQAHSEAERHANRDALDAHAASADRAAQGSAAAAARGANADARAAAGQARANSAKAAAGHRSGSSLTGTAARP